MKIIKSLCEMIEEEVCDAEKYARCAAVQKSEYPQIARTFYSLSEEELSHANKLHDHVVQLIEAHRREHGDPPDHMLSVYDYLHKRHIEHVERVRMLQEIYSGS